MMKHMVRLLAIVVSVFLIGYLLEEVVESRGSLEETIELLSELFSVFVAFSIFTITWHSYTKSRDKHALFVGSSFSLVGILTLFHVLSYPFMPEFITSNSSHKSALFLMESRLFLAILLLGSVYIYKDTFQKLIKRRILLPAVLLLSFISLFLVLTYDEMIYKDIESEGAYSAGSLLMLLMISVFILYACYLYSKRIRETGQKNLIFLIYGSIIIIFSNLFYFYNEFSGHFLIIIGFFFIYSSMYRSSVEFPYEKLALAEEKLLFAAEEKYKNLFDNANDAIITVDPDEKITSWNNASERIFGWKEKEAIGKNISFIFSPSEQAKKNEIINSVMSGGMVSGIDVSCPNKNGEDTFVSMTVSPLRDSNENIIGISAILRDISERKKTEERMRESEELYRTLIENNQDGVFIIQDSRIQFANEAFAGIAGYTVKEVIGKDFKDFIAPEDLDFVINNYQRRQAGENIPREYEFHVLNKDGKTRVTVNMNVSLITYKGKPASMGTLKDITERKIAENIRLENDRLIYANKTKSEFLANVSHDLRTPLNSILGFSELMKQNIAGGLNRKQERYMDNILTSSKFLLELINNILDLAKIEAGKIELIYEKFEVNKAIKDVIVLTKVKTEKKQIAVIKEFDPELELIEADKQRFKQIFFNLLSNAVKFSKDSGGKITIRTKKMDGVAQFSVSDTGIGIKKENLGKLFKKFQQVDPEISRKYGGTGLGLDITKQLVELHEGKILVESKYGEGTNFTFELPVHARKTGEDNNK